MFIMLKKSYQYKNKFKACFSNKLLTKNLYKLTVLDVYNLLILQNTVYCLIEAGYWTDHRLDPACQKNL